MADLSCFPQQSNLSLLFYPFYLDFSMLSFLMSVFSPIMATNYFLVLLSHTYKRMKCLIGLIQIIGIGSFDVASEAYFAHYEINILQPFNVMFRDVSFFTSLLPCVFEDR